jgi:hypothetical protein
MNLAHPRYALPAVLFVEVALCTAAAISLAAWLRRLRGVLGIAATASLFLACAIVHGLPSVRGIREEIDRRHGALTNDLLRARATHVAGDYWNVWPAVFHANLVLHERGEARRIFGISERSRATEHLWRAMPTERWRVAAIPGDSRLAHWLAVYGLEVEGEERVGAIAILRLRSAKPRSGRSPP